MSDYFTADYEDTIDKYTFPTEESIRKEIRERSEKSWIGKMECLKKFMIDHDISEDSLMYCNTTLNTFLVPQGQNKPEITTQILIEHIVSLYDYIKELTKDIEHFKEQERYERPNKKLKRKEI